MNAAHAARLSSTLRDVVGTRNAARLLEAAEAAEEAATLLRAAAKEAVEEANGALFAAICEGDDVERVEEALRNGAAVDHVKGDDAYVALSYTTHDPSSAAATFASSGYDVGAGRT